VPALSGVSRQANKDEAEPDEAMMEGKYKEENVSQRRPNQKTKE
jgi:hypothetical protein